MEERGGKCLSTENLDDGSSQKTFLILAFDKFKSLDGYRTVQIRSSIKRIGVGQIVLLQNRSGH